MKTKGATKIFVFVVVCFVLSGIIVFGANAWKYFPNKYSACIGDSGNRGAFPSVQFACQKASDGAATSEGRVGQVTCSAWLGPTTSSTSRTIAVARPEGTVGIAIWGMCTDYVENGSNKTSDIWFTEDGGSLSTNTKVFNRSMTWGSPNAVPATLDIPKFIAVADKSVSGNTTTYTKWVKIHRCNYNHPDSCDVDDTLIILQIGEETPPPPTSLCDQWMPASYRVSNAMSGTTSIIVKGRNTADRFGNRMSGKWSDMKDGTSPIYAMPTDTIHWHACYYPGVQTTAKTEVSDINGIFTAGGTGGDQYIELSQDTCMGYQPEVKYKTLHVSYTEKIHQWENKYMLNPDHLDHINNNYDFGDFGPGEYAWRDAFEKDGKKQISQLDNSNGGDVGKPGNETLGLEEKGITGIPTKVTIHEYTPSPVTIYENCPCLDANGKPTGAVCRCVKCVNSYKNSIKTASVDSREDTDKVDVVVPYNFINTTNVELPKQDVYSGERGITVAEVSATVNTKDNGVTLANYATVVPKAKIKLFMYVSNNSNGGGIGGMTGGDDGCGLIPNKQCLEAKKDDDFGPLNSGGNLGGDTKIWFRNITFNAFDASAGDYICFASAVWPATSGGDTSTNPDGDNLWKYSEPKCNIISKKPTFQVWGDSMYSVGDVSAYVGNKRNIYNGYFGDNKNDRTKLCNGSVCFELQNGGETHFGSWVEESLILKAGTTGTVASGAATGLNNNPNNYAYAGNTGDFCDERSPLTFANNNCVNESLGTSGINNIPTNRHELIDYWVEKGTELGNCGKSNIQGVPCKILESATGVGVFYAKGDTITTSGTIVGKSETYLIDANTVNITDNIVYDDGGDGYTLLKEIPKVIIYAKYINISCNVKELDAILITSAGGNVTTCSNGGDINSSARQNQLKIFGTVMTDAIELGRTYGAAANQTGTRTDPYGMPSDGAAAEIFDYDSTILMWSEYMSGSAESDTLNTVYQHELAPRY